MITGSLFTQYFLQDGIRQAEQYRNIDNEVLEAMRLRLAEHWRHLAAMPSPSEAETEDEFIYPVLRELGWEWLVQPVADRRRRDVADALLFLDAATKTVARPLPPLDRFRNGTIVVENEARRTLLDRAPTGREAPSSQILRYMSRVEVQSDGLLRWGLLTNGGTWRLYFGRARSRSEGFVGINLADLLDPPPLAPIALPDGAPADHWMRVFVLLFCRDSFVADAGGSFLDAAMMDGRIYEARVTSELSTAVFEKVFPILIRAFARHDPRSDTTSMAWRAEAREGAIRFLYRLLFLLYAEDRDLLPVRHPGYAGYSLRKLREDAARNVDSGTPLAIRAAQRWAQLLALFAAIATGEPGLGLPAYNGGLFKDQSDDILSRVRLPDADLVAVVDMMSRTMEPGVGRRWINYRDLSVQHLGSIYERLLEHDVVEAAATGVALRPSPYARKASGSFYTREELVALVLRQAVEPLLKERRDAFAALVADQGALKALVERDPADAILCLRICDPAMGSGHFLVSLIDHLTDAVLTAMAEAADAAGNGYRSPVAAQIVSIRQNIAASARDNGWAVPEAGLDDRHIVRRMVLKRCVFGVDLNPMAVELSKLSLWLHSFTVGAPLSFLNHHLRCGDSLFGEFVGKAVASLEREYGLAIPSAVVSAQAAAVAMADIEARADADLADVHASESAFDQVEAATAPLRTFLNLYHCARWLPPDTDTDRIGRQLFFGGGYGDPVAIANGQMMNPPRADAVHVRPSRSGKPPITAAEAFRAASAFVATALNLAARMRFLHWEAVFPGVWDGWRSASPTGGFDAVIGNPPWDRIKMQEVEWWAARDADIAAISRAADRKRAIERRRRAGDQLAQDYDHAADLAERAARVAASLPIQKRDGTVVGPYSLYPLFAKGDVNLYALFVERAGQIVRPDGIVGLLVPSGVAADKGAASFFRSISGTGRLGALLDFENGKRRNEPFFPEVHRSFKFSALIHGGIDRRYNKALCAFFQQDAVAAERDAFPITPTEFLRVNPNTGTAPVFRTRRDAEVVLGIYGRLPVLLDRQAEPPTALYPVAYATQLHMTNDSGLFRSVEELEADGAYPVAGGAYERGNTRYLPLMVGRSIHGYDHRYASVLEEEAEEVADAEPATPGPAKRVTRTDKLHNPYSSSHTTALQHEDPRFNPRPRYWVRDTDLHDRWPEQLDWALAFRDIARPTDVRTVIASMVPKAAFGNTLPLLLPALPDPPVGSRSSVEAAAAWRSACTATTARYKVFMPLLMANLNAIVLDYVARNKVQSAHLNAYILEQLPIVPPARFSRSFGPRTAEEIVRQDVLALTYTSDDMAPFARDQGYLGPAFPWDVEDRLRRRARIDAVFMLLYGLDRMEARDVIDSFPILKRQEERAWEGRYRTRDLILYTMAALEAGNPDARIMG